MQRAGKILRVVVQAGSVSLLIPVSASIATGQSAGKFTATGNMITARFQHTATLLPNGKVLIAGGQTGPADAGGSVASAELYDPATGVFTATGDMTTRRHSHSATLLADGRVLIIGGYDDRTVPVATAELYDSSTGAFTAVDNIVLDAPYTVTTATLLRNGQVLITCGTIGPMPPLPDIALLYDSATDALTRTGDLIWNHVGPVATLLSDGKVLIAEGRDPACETTNKPIPCGGSEVYDPASGTFSPTSDVRGSPWRAGPAAALLTNGQVLVAGGDGGNELLRTADLYQPSAAGFTATSDMSISRGSGLAGALLPDGTVLIAGGGSTNIGITATAELYDPSIGIFYRTGDMSTPRVHHAATLLRGGAVMISGGYFGSALTSAELYRPPEVRPPPVLFSLSEDGQGQGAILHAGTARIVSASDPALVGEVLEIYGTGLLDGSVIPPQVTIGGRMAEILFFGKAPGLSGVNQVNVRVPSGVAPSPAVPVRLNYLGRSSNEVTIGVR